MEARMTVNLRSKPRIQVPEGWEFVEGAGLGKAIPDQFDLEWVNVHLDSETWIKGHELVKRGKALNRPLPDMDYAQRLLDCQEYIPVEIRGKIVLVFTGIILRDQDGGLYVLCFCWRGGRRRWIPSFGYLGHRFLGRCRVVCLGK
jgi:hypothetical protein